MNETQLPFLVEAILILITIILGLWLRKFGKPYGKLKPTLHIFFFAWFTTGYGFISTTLASGESSTLLKAAVLIMGLAILTQLISGLRLLLAKQVNPALQKIHITAASTLLIADVAAFYLAGATG